MTGSQRKGKSLLDRFPVYNISWDLPDSARSSDPLLNAAPLHEDTFAIATALLSKLEVALQTKSVWVWEQMSCHLDCWLMSELAFYTHLASSTTLLTDAFVTQAPEVSKLFRVLLAMGTPEQDTVKMAYWAMEIEEYELGSPEARRSFGKSMSYWRHGDFVYSGLRNHQQVDISMTTIGYKPTCTNPAHDATEVVTRKTPTGLGTNVSRWWYSLPDAWNRTKDAQNKWHTTTCHHHIHSNMADILGTLLARTDGETTDCKQCYMHDLSMFQTTWNKSPGSARLPISLEFELDPKLQIPAEAQFTIGEIEYKLICVVFQTGDTSEAMFFWTTTGFTMMGFNSKRPPSTTNPLFHSCVAFRQTIT
jgi:hypothetical protein